MDAPMIAQIDPRLVYTRVPLPDAENAYPLWQEAARWRVTGKLDPPADDQQDCVEGTCFTTWRDKEPTWPEGEFGVRLIKLIEHNGPALKLLDLGIERGKLQFTDIPSPEKWNVGFDDVPGWRDLCRVRSRRILHNVLCGDFEAAGQDAIKQLRMGDMVCNGEGIVVHYLIGMALCGIAQSDILFLARQRTPARVLSDVLAAVERSKFTLTICLSHPCVSIRVRMSLLSHAFGC